MKSTKIKLLVFLSFYLLHISISAQEVNPTGINIKGVIRYNGTPVQDIILTMLDSGNTISFLTNKSGIFEKNNYQAKSAKLEFHVAVPGYMNIDTTLFSASNLQRLEFNLLKDSIYKGTAINIIAKNVQSTANKKIYKINAKNFIVNAKSTAVLKSLPDISIINGNIKLENRKNVLIFIDGIESSKEELDRLDAQDIDKIEIIANPSAVYGGEQSSAVMQIITKKKSVNFIKGELETYAGIRLNQFGVTPTLSLKMKKLIFSTFIGYNTNNQNIENELTRNTNSNIIQQSSLRKITGWQAYSSSRLKLNCSQKSTLYFGSTLFGYNFNGAMTGKNNSNSNEVDFRVRDTEALRKWNISGIYNFTPNKKTDLFLKMRYFNYKNNNQSVYNDNAQPDFYTSIFSNTKELSAEISVNKKSIQLCKLPFEYATGSKMIYRKFLFQSANFNLDQYIHTFYLNNSITLSNKTSLYISLLGEQTNNSGKNLQQRYFYFLPTGSFLYKLNEKVNLHLDYARRITRPSGNYLNPNAIFFDPTYSLIGNINLLPQIRNTYEISMEKQVTDITSINIKFFNEHTSRSIIETFTKINSAIVTTYENAGKSNMVGGYASINTELFKTLSLNFSSGISYQKFESNLANSLVKQNDGIAFTSSLYLSLLLKKIISISLSGSYNTPSYSLINTFYNQPEFGLDAEMAVWKKKLNMRLSYNDMFSLNAKSKNKIDALNFTQTIRNTNKRTNLSLTLIFKFGKNFNDRFGNPGIKNEDIINK